MAHIDEKVTNLPVLPPSPLVRCLKVKPGVAEPLEILSVISLNVRVGLASPLGGTPVRLGNHVTPEERTTVQDALALIVLDMVER